MTTMSCSFWGLAHPVVARLVADAVDQLLIALDSDVDTLDAVDVPVVAWCDAVVAPGGSIVEATVTADGASRISVELRLNAPLEPSRWEEVRASDGWAIAAALFSEMAVSDPATVGAQVEL